MQTDLRVILLAIGLMVILWIVIDGWQRKSRKIKQSKFSKTVKVSTEDLPKKAFKKPEEDKLSSQKCEQIHNAIGSTDPPVSEMGAQISGNKQDFPTEKNVTLKMGTIISLILVPKDQLAFCGKALATALKNEKFQFGKHDIFHQYVNHDPKQGVVCSVASLVEPGTFNSERLSEQKMPGVILYMLISHSRSSKIDFEKMLMAGRRLQAALNGVLCDSQRKALTFQGVEDYRAKIRDAVDKGILLQGGVVR